MNILSYESFRFILCIPYVYRRQLTALCYVAIFAFVGLSCEDEVNQLIGKASCPPPRAIDGSEKHKSAEPIRLVPTSEIIELRRADIARLLHQLQSVGNIELPRQTLNNATVRSLVELRAVEAVPLLCEKITFGGHGGKSATSSLLPAADALFRFGDASLSGIYDYLEKRPMSDREIKIFAFVLYSIDQGDQQLTSFRLKRQIQKRTMETDRNTTFKKNARLLLECCEKPDFFRVENNPFLGH